MSTKHDKDESVSLRLLQGGVDLTISLRLRIELGDVILAEVANVTLQDGPSPGYTPLPFGSSAAAVTEAVVKEAEAAYARVARAQWVGLARDDFSWQNATAMAACSHLAYSEESVVRNVCQSQWRLGETHFVTQGQTQCFVAAHADALIVAFRGTKEFLDWFTNLNVLERRTSFGSVHDGFYQAFLDVSSQLEAHIDRLGSGRPLVLTGHSLGGALATLAAAHWRGKYRVASLYTYGQPCVGLDSFKAFMNVQIGPRYYRFVNAEDIVPRVPPRYVHAGRLIRFDSQGNVVAKLVAEAMLQSVESGDEGQSPTLTPIEFANVQARLESARMPAQLEAVTRQGPVAEERQLEIAQQVVSGGLEGLFPNYFSDHRMGGYLSKIMRQAVE